jgi:NAD(P)-dependent dehydrogenase (short-subunit alcohol dehydrogenase family)
MTTSLFDLQGRTAVVLGGTTGIGHALSLGLADAGADVIASARRQEQVDQTAAAIEAKGRKTMRLTSDVGDRATLESLRDAVLSQFGKVDILVNCAGITKRAPTLDFPEADWDRILDTNLNGTMRSCQVFGKAMLNRGYGRIINIASLSTYVGLFEVAAYAASKAAVGALTKVLAVEWSRHGVLVNAIAPGVFRTDLNASLLDSTERGKEFKLRTPMGRFGKTEELVGAAVYLASDAASFVTGEILVVDGGFLASGVNQ